MRNYWGYNSIAFLAPHNEYAASGQRGEQVGEFKNMVKSLHEAGIEVILDVVYNHTAEGNHLGPTLSMKGIDNAAYYRLVADDRRYYMDYTGTGNSLNMRHPHTLQLVMDSLRYWVTEMHVDGFRFDLASTLARGLHEVDRLSAFFDLIQQDPVVSQVKLIAEPWDVGEGGYQVGNFPPLWSEWNGKYRDVVRDFWRGENAALPEFASRITGSSDLYQADGRHPSASINFVTAHDGFTLADLVSYNDKHNEANGEGNRDGESHNRSWNCGAEGPTEDPEVRALRRRQQRNFLATAVPLPGRPDDPGRRRDGPHPGWQQQRLLPGQRDLVDRLVAPGGERRPGRPDGPAGGVPPRPSRVPPAALVPRAADPRQRRHRHRLVRPRRDRDVGRRLGVGVRQVDRRVPQRRRHPRPRPPGREGDRRQLPGAVQRPLRDAAVHDPQPGLGRPLGRRARHRRPAAPPEPERVHTTAAWEPGLGEGEPVKKGEKIDVGARSLVVLRRVD